MRKLISWSLVAGWLVVIWHPRRQAGPKAAQGPCDGGRSHRSLAAGKGQASIKRPLDKWGSAFVTPTEALAEANPHLGSFSLLARLQHSDCLLG